MPASSTRSSAIPKRPNWAPFPAVHRELEFGRSQGWHYGVQITVLHRGVCVLNGAFGEQVPGEPLGPDTLLLWRSAGKPLTALLVAQHLEARGQNWEMLLSEGWPRLAATHWASVRLRDVVTHQAGFHALESEFDRAHAAGHDIDNWFEHQEPPAGWRIGVDGAYSPQVGWWVLGRWLERVSGSPFRTQMRRSLLDPLELCQTGFGTMPDVCSKEQALRLGPLYRGFPPPLREHPEWKTWAFCSATRPGGNAWGPTADLARFYEAVRTDSVVGLSLKGLQTLRGRHRHGVWDQTFRAPVDLGLGFVLQPPDGDPESVPYAYGRFASSNTFGHGGSQCASAWCDPDRELVVAWVANGLPGESRHQRRANALNAAIYRDLGLA